MCENYNLHLYYLILKIHLKQRLLAAFVHSETGPYASGKSSSNKSATPFVCDILVVYIVCIVFIMTDLIMCYHSQVSHQLNRDDLYQQPFRIVPPMMHRCCHNNNSSPFQNQGGRNSHQGFKSTCWMSQTRRFYSFRRTPLTPSLSSNGLVVISRCVLFGCRE